MVRKTNPHDHLDIPGAGVKARRNVPCGEKFGVVMEEFYQGTLRSGSGQTVTKRSQAQAIAGSEVRACKRK
jgi:hypothetical protein